MFFKIRHLVKETNWPIAILFLGNFLCVISWSSKIPWTFISRKIKVCQLEEQFCTDSLIRKLAFLNKLNFFIEFICWWCFYYLVTSRSQNQHNLVYISEEWLQLTNFLPNPIVPQIRFSFNALIIFQNFFKIDRKWLNLLKYFENLAYVHYGNSKKYRFLGSRFWIKSNWKNGDTASSGLFIEKLREGLRDVRNVLKSRNLSWC